MRTSLPNQSRTIGFRIFLLATFITASTLAAVAQVNTGDYQTHFSVAESPLSDQGKWVDGKSVGLEWSSVRATQGKAFGAQQGSPMESVAVLQGNWPADQTTEARVQVENRVGVQQVILRLRSTLSAHKLSGYEIRFSVGAQKSIQITRANGAPNAMIQLASTENFPVSDGDTVKAKISGNVITAYLNGKPVLHATDNKATTGAPGFGFFVAEGGADSNFGVTDLNASSKSATAKPALTATTMAATASATTSGGTYTTSFPATENPISEGGKWINGATTGLKWQNVRTTSGLAFGTESGSGSFDDSTAVLSGSWGPNQTAQATIKVVQADSGSGLFEEVEVRLHTTITANSITGYEINCSVIAGNPYMQIVRWNGAFGSWTELDGRSVGCQNGDVLKATISGSTITAYKNGSAVFSVTDSTFSGGSPGIGFYLQGGSSSLDPHYGFSNFTASDGTTGTTLNPPTGLTATPH